MTLPALFPPTRGVERDLRCEGRFSRRRAPRDGHHHLASQVQGKINCGAGTLACRAPTHGHTQLRAKTKKTGGVAEAPRTKTRKALQMGKATGAAG